METNKHELSAARRRRREFIQAHHPDRGGDPAAFIAGLQSLAADLRAGVVEPDLGPLPPVFIVKRRRWPLRLASATARRLGPDRRPPRVR